ncbi:hypothetical protein KQ940_10165 [Marinobacterium sp. D7]|nr:hypothetical protein [Marinobacterium ramblicola]
MAYAKWKGPEPAARERPAEAEPDNLIIEITEPWTRRVFSRLTELPERVDSLTFWGQVALFTAFFVWGWSFILGGIDWVSIGGSFLHNANLPFHEFGHVLFSPFGRYMAILGGSLFQVLMPLGLMLAFILQRRDNFAASIMLWWCGQNFIDVSPYIADAPYRAIPLIRGMSEDYHDWGNLLSMSGTLHRAGTYASLWFGTGVVLMLLSFCWGAWLLYRQYQHPSSS